MSPENTFTRPLTLRDDMVLPFSVEPLDVRGRVVRLGPSVDAMLARHAYPPLVARVVGEAVALTALLGSSLKGKGRFQVQTKSDGVIEMVVVDYESKGQLRAYARFDAGRLAQAVEAGGISTGALLGHGHLAMTVEQGAEQTRYQGIVPLEGQSLEEAAHTYFRQSEQIPTRIRLAVGEEIRPSGGHSFRAGGIIVQFLPTSPEHQRQADLDPGDAPEGYIAQTALENTALENDAWMEARSLVETVEDHELIDPTVESERLLYRLFHERGVRVFETHSLQEACRCSHERIVTMLSRFTLEDRNAMPGEDGRIRVSCEFCSREYDVDPREIQTEGEELA